MSFPENISFTITNRCNLHCRMCGQWGSEGYFTARRDVPESLPPEMWKRLVDEVAAHGRSGVGIRGGEPFLYPGIMEVLGHIKARGLRVWIDTNGTLIERYAGEVVGLRIDHLNISVDGPEAIHDAVRGVKGSFARIAKGVAALKSEAGKRKCAVPNLLIVFTISADSYRGLAAMPDVARSLGIGSICIVPFYYFDRRTGVAYEEVMKRDLGSEGWSWRGFHHETSGVDGDEFAEQLRQFKASLGDVQLVPFMKYAESDYRTWFSNCTSKVGQYTCRNAWRLIDIQPDGSANFCVDFPDYVIGNVAGQTIEDVWNGARADRFRARIESQSLPICNRCGAKYMSGSEPE